MLMEPKKKKWYDLRTVKHIDIKCNVQAVFTNACTLVIHVSSRYRTVPSLQKIPLCFFSVDPTILPQEAITSDFCHDRLVCSDMSYRWNHTTGALLCLVFFSIMFETHPCCCRC